MNEHEVWVYNVFDIRHCLRQRIPILAEEIKILRWFPILLFYNNFRLFNYNLVTLNNYLIHHFLNGKISYCLLFIVLFVFLNSKIS